MKKSIVVILDREKELLKQLFFNSYIIFFAVAAIFSLASHPAFMLLTTKYLYQISNRFFVPIVLIILGVLVLSLPFMRKIWSSCCDDHRSKSTIISYFDYAFLIGACSVPFLIIPKMFFVSAPIVMLVLIFAWYFSKKAFFFNNEKKDDLTESNFGKYYFRDDPSSEDLFNRTMFARQIADLVLRRLSDSLTVSINGNWGEGKSTVLSFVEKRLEKVPGVINIHFRPWLFSDERQLLFYFFGLLSEKLKKSLFSSKEILGKIADYAGFILPPVNSSVGKIGAEIDLGKYCENIGKRLCEVPLEDLNDRLKKVLEKEKRQIVVYIDDVDRLDDSSIRTVFKLINLIAKLPYTTYILFFDKNVVAKALGKAYGDSFNDGYSYLEKIINVQIDMPHFHDITFSAYVEQMVGKTLENCRVEISPNDKFIYGECLNLLVSVFGTPRSVKQYCNALLLVLPLIKDEICISDLMLVEVLRLFYPKVHSYVKKNKDFFMTDFSSMHKDREKISQEKENFLKKINTLIGSEDMGDNAVGILRELFPKTNSLYYSHPYGERTEEDWARNKKIASKKYFERYFAYSVSNSDISDTLFNEFLKVVVTDKLDVMVREMYDMIKDGKDSVFISKLKNHIDDIPSSACNNLAVAIAKQARFYSNPDAVFSFFGTFFQAAVLAYDLIIKLPNDFDKFEVAKKVIQESDPVSFAVDFFSWMQNLKAEKKEENFYTPEVEQELGVMVANRLKLFSDKQSIVFNCVPNAWRLFDIWVRFGHKSEVIEYLKRESLLGYDSVIQIVKCFGYKVAIGNLEIREFRRESYDFLSSLIDPSALYERIIERRKDLADIKELLRHEDVVFGDNKKIKHEDLFIANFILIHRRVQEEKWKGAIDITRVPNQEDKKD